jgi:predicted cupin superfamily sugar epimerase
MVTPSAPVHLHRIRNDQLYHYYLGDPLEVLMLPDGGSAERVVVGPDLGAGQRVQLFIPGNTFHTARLAPKGSWFLGGSTEWPGVLLADVETGDIEELEKRFPGAAADLRAFAVGAARP